MNEVLDSHHDELAEIISNEIKQDTFESHDLINILCDRRNSIYCELLLASIGEDPGRFNELNTKITPVIGKYLLKNAEEFHIRKSGKSNSENVNQNFSDNTWWEKI